MPISSLAQILIRIFALFWTVFGAIAIAAQAFAASHSMGNQMALQIAVIRIFLGTLLWFFAPTIAWAASRGNDQELQFKGITETQLFSTAFVALGIYFALSALPDISHGLYLLITVEEQLTGDGMEASMARIFQQSNFTKELLIRPTLSFGFGVVSILSARAWAKKLTRS